MQIIHNHNVIELDGVQVAEMVLGIKSSGGSENMLYYSGGDARRVASELVSENLAGDDENREKGEEQQNRDNGNAEGNSVRCRRTDADIG